MDRVIGTDHEAGTPEYDREMGEVRVSVRLENASDKYRAVEGSLGDRPIRFYSGIGIVDTGAIMLAIPESVSSAVGLIPTGSFVAGMADGARTRLPVAGPVDITIKGRTMTTEAAILPSGTEILIGQIVLERLDLFVDCRGQTLVPRPESPDIPLLNML